MIENSIDLSNYDMIDIISIEDSDECQTYDIEVDSVHRFEAKNPDEDFSSISHNSATICLFSHDDEDMMKAKTGDWYLENPQRSRSNNSAVIVRDEITKEEYNKITPMIKEFGEPGFVFFNSKEHATNPCVSGETLVHLKDHDITENGKLIAYGTSYTLTVKYLVEMLHESGGKRYNMPLVKSKNLETGEIEYKQILAGSLTKKDTDVLGITDKETGKSVTVTPDHKIYTKNRGWVEAQNLENIDTLDLLDSDGNRGIIIERKKEKIDVYDITVEDNHNFYGDDILVHNCVEIGMYPSFEGESGWQGCVSYGTKLLTKNGIETIGEVSDNNKTIEIWNGKNWSKVKPFHTGSNRKLFRVEFSDGSYLDCTDNHKFVLKTNLDYESIELKDIMPMVLKGTKFLLPKPNISETSGSEYVEKEYSDEDFSVNLLPEGIFTWNALNILEYITNLFSYNKKVRNELSVVGDENYIRNLQLLITKTGSNTKITKIGEEYKIKISIDEELFITGIEELDGLHDSYCFEESELHQGVFNNVLTNQCNLSEINGSKCITKEEFFKACRGAAIIGTLQAGYTNFNFLGDASRKIFERESLLGVSITGWMNNPDILFDEDILKEGARIVKKINKKVAKLLGINPAARTTCVKPSGNVSVILETATGIHPEHSKRYIRHVQMNKETEVAQLLKDKNPYMVEDSQWGDTDYVIGFPVVTNEKSLYRKDMVGTNLLEKVKLVQKTWVECGTNVDLCVDPTLRHNVSNTVTVPDGSWDEVFDYVYDNKKYFTGISFLSDFGDKDFVQAPNTEVLSEEEILEKYGKASFFASGLIVDVFNGFDNLWEATMIAQQNSDEGDKEKVDNRQDWIRRFHKFADNYFDGDLKETGYCLKDIYLLHKWTKIQQNLQPVDFTNELKTKKYTEIDTMGAAACVGGGCEI